MTFRSVRILRDDVQLIACEDTRTTQKLLNHYAISKPLLSYHEHNEASRTASLIERMTNENTSVALLTDAGTPLISDPGYRLVVAAVKAGIPVVPLPGACAAVLALAASGLPTDQFRFCGFLPPKAGTRRTFLEACKNEPVTLIAYESPHRILDTLADLAAVLPERPIVLARELTKLHEELLRGNASEIASVLNARSVVKGEITLVIGGAEKEAETGDPLAEIERLQGAGVDRMDAIKAVAKRFGLPKREVYRLSTELDSNSPDKHRD